MFPEYFEDTLQNLENQIKADSELLQEFQEELRFAENPRAQGKYRREIQRQKESISQYKQEYQEIQQEFVAWQQSNSSSCLQVQKVERQFQQIDEKLNILIIDQRAIADDLAKTRQNLLNRYDLTEQVALGAIAQKLNQSQLALTQKLLYATEANLVSEEQMQKMLAVLEERIPYLPPSSQADKVAKIIKDPTIDTKHKLKVSLPIVPLLVNYEGTIELGSGFNLKTGWEQLIAKLRRKPQKIGKTIGNYSELRKFLEQGEWKKADLETIKMILEVTQREQQGWLKTQDIEKFPLKDLEIIDNLWVKFSQGKFGFSVQRDIWLSIDGYPGKFDSNIFLKFGNCVGWNISERWLKYDQLTFSLDAPEGHLPSLQLTGVENEPDWLGLWKDTFKGFLSRVEAYLSNR